MQQMIKENINEPKILEKLYRDNKTEFKKAFNLLYHDTAKTPLLQAWHERLNFVPEEITETNYTELAVVIIASFVAGLIAKIPSITSIDETVFYPRNLAFIVFPALTAYFAWRQKLTLKQILVPFTLIIIAAIFINCLPDLKKSDSLLLSCIHLPLFLWSIFGFVFVGASLQQKQKRLNFLRYNGDLLVMVILILMAGALLTSITLGLFSLINFDIHRFYIQYVVVWGLSASPVVGSYLVQNNPQLVNRVSPIIAKVFTPIVFATLVIYLVAVIISGKDPYKDRDFLMIFNLLLIGVMAIILFSISERSTQKNNQFTYAMLFGLSLVTIIINTIALSAILFRIGSWGITPNRLAVLGGNVLILLNLIFVCHYLFKTVRDENQIEKAENSIAGFLPIYTAWTVVVTFIFPLVFGFN